MKKDEWSPKTACSITIKTSTPVAILHLCTKQSYFEHKLIITSPLTWSVHSVPAFYRGFFPANLYSCFHFESFLITFDLLEKASIESRPRLKWSCKPDICCFVVYRYIIKFWLGAQHGKILWRFFMTFFCDIMAMTSLKWRHNWFLKFDFERKPSAGDGGRAPSHRRPMGIWGLAPSRRRLEVWEQSLQPPETRVSGGGAPSARRFLRFFNKSNAFLGIFRLKYLL